MNYIITVGAKVWTGEDLSDEESSAEVFGSLDAAREAVEDLPKEIGILASYKEN